ncbi:DNA-3-methyladenine glycosylase 2 family protein [Pseudoclavibacter chungangensis]|uniref:DNA-3-methyladenine glycosylase II n=1 Tax=Pseudoclavibacter chungangensis TaxID=587635 RepID=A0A7J5BN14_9MICO|nr:AlkA N-terminal domain-containing protein [Pseudoclavibacter chungangensis]KAB1653278.1 DNA-3-methyladenine glycosylase 2 family protein [Pseudoclavibacter chungangensis]NYJ66967.1 3-methyladenine DNA glycosylase/8-oxoguanine DNA glycosylase [Pseudoclavibacter chungangensis]
MNAAPSETRIRLDVTTPFAALPLRRFLTAHAVPGLERFGPGSGWWTRRVDTPSGTAVVTVRLPAEDVPAVRSLTLPTIVRADEHDAVEAAVEAVRRALALDESTDADDAVLVDDPEVGPLVRARPGLRIPGAVDPAETALLVVLGQQVSLAAARTLQGRLVAWTAGMQRSAAVDGLVPSPDPAIVAEAHPAELRDALRVPVQRVRAIQSLAEALADGLDVGPGADIESTRRALLDLPGIGPWTVDYTAMRTLRDPDAFPASDLVLLGALGRPRPAEATRRAEAWRPHRSRATMHLWTAAAYA